MFQQMIGHDDVKRVVFKRDLVTIEVMISPRTVQIRRHIIHIGKSLEPRKVAVLRSQMQHPQRGAEEGRLALHESPYRPVSLQT